MCDVRYLSLGSNRLDQLMAFGAEEPQTGIKIVANTAPIILIQGAVGIGKTTLMMQMATKSAKSCNRSCDRSCAKHTWRVFYYSLEEPVVSLNESAKEFGFLGNGDKLYDLDEKENEFPTLDKLTQQVVMCHFSPLSRDDGRSASPVGTAFERRLQQLGHVLERAKKLGKNNVVFFLDSLNAMSMAPLSREEVYRLFEVFRKKKVPLVVSVEGKSQADETSEAARYLADVVIELTSDEQDGASLLQLEIVKSRVGRQAHGKHAYKVITNEYKEDAEASGGILVYPSVQSELALLRDKQKPGENQQKYFITHKQEGTTPVGFGSIFQDEPLGGGSCIAVVGPSGTHKLALALNLATGLLAENGKERRKALIISFDGHGEIDLKKAPWFLERQRDFGSPDRLEFSQNENKEKWAKWRFMESDFADVLAFRVGNLSAEECLHAIKTRLLEDNRYSAVLFNDTAQLHAGFPRVCRNPLFMPALVELFESKGLTSVWIGVESSNQARTAMDAALLARANYRIRLSQYPEVAELMEWALLRERAKVKNAEVPETDKPRFLNQQTVSLVVDKTGKHYDHIPVWLWVEDGAVSELGFAKELKCGDIPPRTAVSCPNR